VIPPPSLANIIVPVGGYSLPIDIDLDLSPPYSKLIVESYIPILPDLRLDYGYVSDYKFLVSDY